MHADGVLRKHDAQKRFYTELRRRFGLSAQPAIRVIGKVADAYTTLRANVAAGNYGPPGSRATQRQMLATPIVFRADAAQPFDARCLSWQIPDVCRRPGSHGVDLDHHGRLRKIRILGRPEGAGAAADPLDRRDRPDPPGWQVVSVRHHRCARSAADRPGQWVRRRGSGHRQHRHHQRRRSRRRCAAQPIPQATSSGCVSGCRPRKPVRRVGCCRSVVARNDDSRPTSTTTSPNASWPRLNAPGAESLSSSWAASVTGYGFASPNGPPCIRGRSPNSAASWPTRLKLPGWRSFRSTLPIPRKPAAQCGRVDKRNRRSQSGI